MQTTRQTLRDAMELYQVIHDSEDPYLLLRGYNLDSRLNKDILNKQIVLRLGSNTVLYNTTDDLKLAIESFFDLREYDIRKLVDTMYFDYNPIWNADYHQSDETKLAENIEDDTAENIDDSTEETIKDSTNEEVSDTRAQNGTTENTVSAYNASDYQPKDKETVGNNETATRDRTEGFSRSRGEGYSRDRGESYSRDRDQDTTYEKWLRGNYGQTTTQQMIREERDLYEWNIYNWIINLLEDAITLVLY